MISRFLRGRPVWFCEYTAGKGIGLASAALYSLAVLVLTLRNAIGGLNGEWRRLIVRVPHMHISNRMLSNAISPSPHVESTRLEYESD
jgi:hypothetical protein